METFTEEQRDEAQRKAAVVLMEGIKEITKTLQKEEQDDKRTVSKDT